MDSVKKAIQRVALCLALAGVIPLLAAAQGVNSKMDKKMSTGNTGSLSTADRQFVDKAAQGGMAEVQLGELAKEKGSSDAVKQFGQRMVNDHTKANDQLKQLAANKGIELPSTLDSKDEATKTKLSKLSGAAFDRAYMRDMVTDHTHDVAEFRHESESAKDAAVTNFATETLPTLESHLKSAKSVDSNLKARASAK